MILVQILPSAMNVSTVESCRILWKLLLLGNQPSSQERHLQSPQAVLRKMLVLQQQVCILVAATVASSCKLHMQVSSRESKDGNEAKLEACETFSRVIAAGLHRVATAMAKDSECITKASKVSQWVKDDVCMICFAAHLIYVIVPMLGLSLYNEPVSTFHTVLSYVNIRPRAHSSFSHAPCTLHQMKFSYTLLPTILSLRLLFIICRSLTCGSDARYWPSQC